MKVPYYTRPVRRQEAEAEDFPVEQEYHTPYLHPNCQQCNNALFESINNGSLENDFEILNTINEAYFNEEAVNSFDVYRHFHPLYNFNHNPYQNSFSPVALPNKRTKNSFRTGNIILLRLVLSGKTFQGIITNPELLTNERITDYSSNSNKPGYYVQAYGNTGGNRNENVYIRIADNNGVTAGNVIILRKLSLSNSANDTDSSSLKSIQLASVQEDQQEYFTEENEYESDPSVPDLISRDTTPALETLYVTIDLGLRKECVRKKPPEYKCIESLKFNVEPKTGIFIPATFTAGPQVDLLIYLHGHKSGFVSHGRDLPIDGLWDAAKKPKFAFREIVNASGKNLILVAPTLGPLSQAGNLTSSEGFTSFVSKVLTSLSSYCSLYSGQQTPTVRSIILAAHSGGGEPMRRIANLTGNNDFANLITECWGFDSTYSKSDPPEWYNWANTNPGKSLYLFSIPGTSTARNAALIQAKKSSLPNIHLTASGTGDHNSVPRVYMAERLGAITALTESYDESDNEDCGCDCEEDTDQFYTESFENIFTEQSSTAAAGTQEHPMMLYNIPFAPLPAAGGYWPLRTNRSGRLVSYLAVNKTTIGKEGRRFLARRDNRSYNGTIRKYIGTKQNRWHAGIDLFANIGDEVVACEAGKIINLQYFYKARSGQKTYGILVEHAGCVVNYGEVTGDSLTRNNLHEGDNVAAGQVIGFVSDTGMLHFETYSLREDHKYHNLQWWMLPETPDPPAGLLNPTQYLLYLRQNGLPAEVPLLEMIDEEEDSWWQNAQDIYSGSEPTSFDLPADDYTITDNNIENSNSTAHPTLRYGARGSEVLYMQQRLNYHSTAASLPVKEDGIWGQETHKAVLSFQNRKGLVADGIAGPKTWAALDADENVLPGILPPVLPPDNIPPDFPPGIIPADFKPPVVPVIAKGVIEDQFKKIAKSFFDGVIHFPDKTTELKSAFGFFRKFEYADVYSPSGRNSVVFFVNKISIKPFEAHGTIVHKYLDIIPDKKAITDFPVSNERVSKKDNKDKISFFSNYTLLWNALTNNVTKRLYNGFKPSSESSLIAFTEEYELLNKNITFQNWKEFLKDAQYVNYTKTKSRGLRKAGAPVQILLHETATKGNLFINRAPISKDKTKFFIPHFCVNNLTTQQNGDIIQFVDIAERTIHGETLNDKSIGIEFVNTPFDESKKGADGKPVSKFKLHEAKDGIYLKTIFSNFKRLFIPLEFAAEKAGNNYELEIPKKVLINIEALKKIEIGAEKRKLLEEKGDNVIIKFCKSEKFEHLLSLVTLLAQILEIDLNDFNNWRCNLKEGNKEVFVFDKAVIIISENPLKALFGIDIRKKGIYCHGLIGHHFDGYLQALYCTLRIFYKLSSAELAIKKLIDLITSGKRITVKRKLIMNEHFEEVKDNKEIQMDNCLILNEGI